MNRASLSVIAALFASVIFHPGVARAINGAVQAERWTYVNNTVDSNHYTHFQFRRQLFSIATNGTITLLANYGQYDYKRAPGQPDDDSYAILQRQLINGAYLMVPYTLDTDPDKASFAKVSGPMLIDSPTDAYSWVMIQLAPSSPTTALDAAWNLLQSAYTSTAGNFSQLSQALIGWRGTNFGGLSYDDQLQFSQRAFAHGLLGTNLREIEATLRAAGFPMDLSQLMPANGVDLALTSAPTYAVNGSNVTVSGINLTNNRSTQTGQVKLDLYAFPTSFLGGALTNQRLIATATLADPIDAGASVSSVSFSGAFSNIPTGTYGVALLVSDDAGRTDHYSFVAPLQVGPIGGISAVEQSMPTQLVSLSTRLRVELGDGVPVAGFTLSGSKKVIVRALGPSLGPARLPSTLPATSLQLFNGSGALLESNTGWMNSPNKQAIIDSGFQPTSPQESAIVRVLPAGTYTAKVSGLGNAMGTAQAEMYDLDRANLNVRPLYVSTRGHVQAGLRVIAGSFTIGGSRARLVIVRALGPSLTASAGIAAPLLNPQLSLSDSNGNVMYSNSGWQNSDQAAAITASGKAPPDPRESAIIVTLAPGTYTATISGLKARTGIAQFEVFDLQ